MVLRLKPFIATLFDGQSPFDSFAVSMADAV